MRPPRRFALLCALMAPSINLAAAGPDIRSQYEERKASVGRTADAQFDLALWCERNGLPDEKFKHLALAIAADPAHAKARGLMGLMEIAGRWGTPQEAAEERAKDKAITLALSEYNVRRAKAKGDDAADQARLAQWCEERGLIDESRAHWSTVARLDPSRDVAWRKLGFRKQDGRWVLPEQVAARKAEAKAQDEADRRWAPALKKIRVALEAPTRREEGQASLDAIGDPRAAPSIIAVLATGDLPLQQVAIDALARLDGAPATQALARLAIHAKDPECRRLAGETLRSRDPRETFLAAAGYMRPIAQYKVVPVTAMNDGTITIRGPKNDIVRVYEAAEVRPNFAKQLAQDVNRAIQLRGLLEQMQQNLLLYNSFSGLDPTTQLGLPGAPLTEMGRYSVNLATMPSLIRNSSLLSDPAQQIYSMDRQFSTVNQERADIESSVNERFGRISRMNAPVQQRQQADIQALEAYNALATEINGRAGLILRDITGQSLGDEPGPWHSWFMQEQTGTPYRSDPEPTEPRRTVYQVVASAGVIGCECFAAGTPIHTVDGLRPIDSLSPGDRVLAQDVATGALSYRPVLTVHRTPDAFTVTVDTDRETITTTGPHRFWKAGRGWVMARDLKPGDAIRTLDATATVRAVTPDPDKQTVFNLDVDGKQTMFVGQTGWLAHDHSLPPLMVNRPFDAAAPSAP